MIYHRFAYSMALRSGEEPNLAKIRDGAAFGEIAAPLAKLGYEYGQILYNPPYNSKKPSDQGRGPFNFIKADELIVLTTRPPLDDSQHGDKKLVRASRTHLEKQVFAECRKYLEVCARSHVQLTPDVAGNFKKAELVFHQHKNARLKNYRKLGAFRPTAVPKKSNISIGFFLRTKSIPEYGCGLLASFGMSGWETLIWNRIVRTRHSEWVGRHAFIMAEFDLPHVNGNPLTLHFVDQIKPRILLEHPIK